MNKEERNYLHCGACGKKVKTPTELVEHIKNCRSAKLGTMVIKQAVNVLFPKKRRNK
jgi:hypothetical protein